MAQVLAMVQLRRINTLVFCSDNLAAVIFSIKVGKNCSRVVKIGRQAMHPSNLIAEIYNIWAFSELSKQL